MILYLLIKYLISSKKGVYSPDVLNRNIQRKALDRYLILLYNNINLQNSKQNNSNIASLGGSAVIKKRLYSIKDLREYLDLSQEQLARLAGLSGVYLSQVETKSRPLTEETSKKIADALGWLFTSKEDREKGYTFYIPPTTIEREHMVSFYPEEVQSKMLELIDERVRIDYALNELKKGRITETKERPAFYPGEELLLSDLLSENKAAALENAKEIKDEYKLNKTVRPVSQRIDPEKRVSIILKNKNGK